MRVEVSEDAPGEVEADLLAVAAYEGELAGRAAELDALLDGRLTRLASDGELTGKLGTAAVVHVDGGVRAGRVAVAGLGRRDAADDDALRTAAAAAARAARVHGGTLAWAVDGSLPIAEPDQARLAVEGASLAAYDPGQWKTRNPKERPLERLLVVGGDGLDGPARRAGIVAAWANRARDLVNTPPNEAPPARFAERAGEIAAAGGNLRVAVLGPLEIQALGMGALAAVARASRNEPRLVAVHYDPPGPAHPDVVLGFV